MAEKYCESCEADRLWETERIQPVWASPTHTRGVAQDRATVHDVDCEADWGPEGQESPCRCGEKPTSIMRGSVSDGQFRPTSDWEQI